MEVKELRIDNWIKYNFKIQGWNDVQVCANDFHNGFRNDKFVSMNYKPIPLTEEWLLKFGFVFTKISQGFNQYRNGNVLQLSITPNGFEFFFNYKWINIKNVHQLQNLNFALTNEELKLT
tara:strand:+ start:587 stop:946 length:360 start_codon:yes stop_codon:yes gene_type:complete